MRFNRIWTLLGAGAMTAALITPQPSAAEAPADMPKADTAPTPVPTTPVPTTPAPTTPAPTTPVPTTSARTTPAPVASEPVPVDTAPVDCSAVKCVALTFDDGPGIYTPKLLTLLERQHARATFFVVGYNTRRYPKVLRRIVGDGFELGTHTQSHPDLRWLPPSRVRAQIRGPIDDIVAAGQPAVTLLRPPYGATNAKVTKVARKLGLAQILWSVDPQDWAVHNSRRVAGRILSHVSRGSIILVHDIHPTTVGAMPKVIKTLQKRGFHLVTVSQLLGPKLEPGRKYFRQ
ncbi:polysaccharide deacetylase family protein [Nonomuraea sp. NPDC050536]|uniref:polysaccharide deacetylase family protein n=1 Tax=Nonomuraea sp. NPDC050536 TaxID=3364366 RepID=UPI0037C59DB4